MDKICNFTKGQSMTALELSLLCSKVAMSIAYGTAIEIEHFDGFVRKRKTLTAVDRVDAANALKQLSWLLAERLAAMTEAEKLELDRIQKVLADAK
jgi:hypothetical protein